MESYNEIMLKRDIAELKQALMDSTTALDDWISTYAPELCRKDAVESAEQRIFSGGGTLSYIGRQIRTNNKLLKP
jgi:hypothetical protein